MKKILLMIIGVFSLLLITIPSAYAASVERKVNFTVSNPDPTTSTKDIFYDASLNMFDELDKVYSEIVEDSPEGSQIKYYSTTIKRNGVVMDALISRRYVSDYDATRYTIRISFTANTTIQMSVYSKNIVYSSELANPWSKALNVNQIHVYFISSYAPNASDPVATYELSDFVETELDPDDGTTISDYSELPITTGTLSDALNSDMVGYVYFNYVSDNNFETFIIVDGQQFNLGMISLPGVEELNKEPLSPGIYWTENGTRYIYYEFQQPASVKPISEQINMFLEDTEQEVNGFRPFVTMNLTDDTYVFTDKLKLYAGFYSGDGGKAFADVVFPIDIDQLLSIEIYYKYRWETLWGLSYTEWTDATVGRYMGEVVDMRSTWQHIVAWVNWFEFYDEVASWINGPSATIQEIPVITADYKTTYTKLINDVRTKQYKTALTEAEIFAPDSSVYRVYLNTFNDGRYTNYQIHDDIVIMDVMYEYKGEIYHVAYDDIVTDGSFGGVGSGTGGGTGLGGSDSNGWDWSWLTNIFSTIPSEYLIIGVIALGVLFFKPIKKFIKNIADIVSNPRQLILFAILIIAALYFLGFL